MKQEIITRLEQILTKDRIRQNEPMKNHTTFRVGGPADIFLTPSAEELPAVLSVCREEQMPVTVIGNGSNLLVGDQGIRGVVICIGFGMRGIRVDGEKIFLEAGPLRRRHSRRQRRDLPVWNLLRASRGHSAARLS